LSSGNDATGGQRRSDLLTGAFVRIMLVNFGYFLSIGVINPVLPRFIRGPLGASDIGVGVGISAFTVSALALRLFSGRFGDRRGRHLPIRVGALINTAAMAGYHLAHSLGHVVALRLLTGVAEALIFVGVATAVQDLSPDDRRGEAASLFSLSLFMALAVGPIIGEQLLDHFGYSGVWTFAAGAAGFAVLLSFTIGDTRTHGASDAAAPLIHPAALKPGFILACAIWGLAAFNGYMPLYALQIGLHGASTVFLANAVVILLFRSIGARIPDRVGALRTARMALFCTPLGLGIMGAWQSVPGLYTGAVVMAVGQAMAFPALMSVAVNNAPGNERGAVMGTFTAFFDLSFGGGAFALGFVADAVGYNGTFLTAMGVASVGFAMLLFAPPRVAPRHVPPRPVSEIIPPGE
jgi:MFS family permease